MAHQSKYIVCVDHTDISRMALRFACIKARKRNIRLDILHVIPPSDVQTMGAVAEKMEQEQREAAEKILQSLAEEAIELMGSPPQLSIRSGKVSDEIIAHTLDDADANMLVLGVTPGSKSGNRVISYLTSQAGEKLLVPMMLVPGNLTDQQMEAVA